MIFRADLSGKALVIAELEPFVMRLLQEVPHAADPDSHAAARERLFPAPSAPGTEEEFREDWREYVQPELVHLFATARETVEQDLQTLSAELEKLDARGAKSPAEHEPTAVSLAIPRRHLDAWLSALNQARLALGAQHDIGEKEINVRLENLAEEERLRSLLQMHFIEVAYHLLVEPPTEEPERAMLKGHFGNVLRHIRLSADPPLTERDHALLRINFYDVLQQLILRELEDKEGNDK